MSQQQPSAGQQQPCQADSRPCLEPRPPQQPQQKQRMQSPFLAAQDHSTAKPQQKQRMQSPFLAAQGHSADEPVTLTAHLLEALQRCHIQPHSQDPQGLALQCARKPQQQQQQGLPMRAPEPLRDHPSRAAAPAAVAGSAPAGPPSLQEPAPNTERTAGLEAGFLQGWGSFTAAETDAIAQLLQEAGTDDLGTLLENCLEEAAERARSESVQTSSAVVSGLLLLGDRDGSLSSSCSYSGAAATESGAVTIDWDAMLCSELSVAGLGSMNGGQDMSVAGLHSMDCRRGVQAACQSLTAADEEAADSDADLAHGPRVLTAAGQAREPQKQARVPTCERRFRTSCTGC